MVVAGVLAVAFCGCDSASVRPPDDPVLESTWKLRSYGPVGRETTVITGTEVTAIFGGDGSVSGRGGCNSYWAEYEAGRLNRLSVGAVRHTKVFCSVPTGVVPQEDFYFEALGNAVRFVIIGRTLVIFHGEEPEQLVFDVANQ